MFNQDLEKLGYNSSKEDFDKIPKLRSDLYDKFIGKLDEKIRNIPALKDKQIHYLFEKILLSEKLDDLTIQDIQNIRSNKGQIRWYERKVIINAIALSLIGFKKFDQKKAHILIDFLTDFEENVWEHALTGLIIPLIHHQNKWEKFESLKLRLILLKANQQVQNAIESIDYILYHRLYLINSYGSNIYKSDFFNSPANCFLPFYENNPVFQNALENNNSGVDLDHFSDYFTQLPFLDAHKYSLCAALVNESITSAKLSNEESKIRIGTFQLSIYFKPYLNIISEYYCFIAYFPKNKIEDIFKSQFSLAKTKLKTLILDRTNELMMSADSYINEGRYSEALPKLLDLYKIDPENVKCLWQLSECYVNIKKRDYKQALKYLHKLLLLGDGNYVWERIGYCYLYVDNFNEAINFFSKCIKNKTNSIDSYTGLAKSYIGLKDHESALINLRTAEEKFPNNFDIDSLIVDCYIEKEESEIAATYILKHIENLETEVKAEEFRRLSVCYENTDLVKSLNYAEMAFKLDSKDYDIMISLARSYILNNKNLEKAESLILKNKDFKKRALANGNLAHLYLIQNKQEKALENYQKCISNLKNVEDFKTRCDKDVQLITNLGVPKEHYLDIINGG